jgi:hypothetical protein
VTVYHASARAFAGAGLRASALPTGFAVIVRLTEAGINAFMIRLSRPGMILDLPADTDAGDLARYVSTVMYGMAVRAAGGASRKELLRVEKMALRAWPAGGA